MVYLSKIENDFLGNCTYSVKGDECPVERYVVSTPETTAICNCPQVTGMSYKRRLKSAVKQALISLPEIEQISSVPDESVCVLEILRGSLNFGIDDAVADAWGMNSHGSAFVSSQRKPAECNGTYEDGCIITEDSYKKLEIPEHTTILCGDVVATGTTLRHNLRVLCRHIEKNELKPRNLVFFTIGCDNAEIILSETDRRLRRASRLYNRTIVVYFEGRFSVASKKLKGEFLEKYSIKPSDFESQVVLPGTDLIRHPALLAPEFEDSQFNHPAYPIERCTIYDAGSRAFFVPKHLDDVREYWEILRRLGERGVSLGDMIAHRLPVFNNRQLAEDAKRKWAEELDIDVCSRNSLEELAEAMLRTA